MYKIYFHQVKNNSNESDSMRFDTVSRIAACYCTTSLDINNNSITFQCENDTYHKITRRFAAICIARALRWFVRSNNACVTDSDFRTSNYYEDLSMVDCG